VSQPLVDRLRSPDPDERRDACRVATADPAAVIFLEALGERLDDPVKAVAQAASDALVALAAEHDVMGVLRDALHSGPPVRRLWAALTLARLEPPALKLVPALVDGLALPDGKLRWWAARRLVETGRLHAEVLPVLLGLSRSHAQPVVRRMARHCLRELGRGDPDAASALVEATRDPEPRARRAGYAALASLLDPPPAVIERLAEALAMEPDEPSRRIASVALGALGAARPEAIDEAALRALHAAREDPRDPELRRGAARALHRIEAARSTS
jgi:HEAT repeat protein